MSRTKFLLGYALRSLRRSGQRSVLAVVCITFGVMALVGMQLLAHAITVATVVDPRLEQGGDILTNAPAPLLDSLVGSQQLASYTTVTHVRPGMLRSASSSRVHFLGRAMAVDPAAYPLAGELRMRGNVSLADAIARPGHVVLTRDMADALGAQVGDTLRSGEPQQGAVTLVLGGIADVMPDRQGQTMLFGPATAALFGDAVLLAQTSATYGGREGAADALRDAGYTAQLAEEQKPDSVGRIFGMMLKGAGILGLLVGGIGVAYTLQVMLARRRMEIATLRSIGYGTRPLVLLFGAEAALLGLAGGVLGSAGAFALSAQLTRMLGRVAGSMMIETAHAPLLLALGPVVGVATTVLFGAAAIVRAAGVRPGVLLRDLPVRATRAAGTRSGGLYLLLAALFTAIAASVMGSLGAGIIVVLLAVIGTLLLGGLLAGMLWLAVRLPLPRLPLLNMARANLRTRPTRSAFAMIALFIGVFSVGFATAAMLTGRDRVASKRGSDEGFNLRVFAAPGEREGVADALRAAGATDVVAQTSLAVETEWNGRTLGLLGNAEVLDAREVKQLAEVSSGAGDSYAGALVPARLADAGIDVALGDTLLLTTARGSVRLPVTGFYTGRDTELFANPRGVIIPPAAALALRADTTASVFMAALPTDALATATAALGGSLPQSMVMSRADLNDFLVTTYSSLFAFVIAVAGLALLAGAVLIANAVALAMLERRRELGILKAIGYTSRRVLRTVLLENATLGVVAGVVGIAAVHIVMMVLNAREESLRMTLGAVPSAAMVAVAVGLALAAAAAVAWGPVHARPLEVLRDE